jgi:hypothetical protein
MRCAYAGALCSGRRVSPTHSETRMAYSVIHGPQFVARARAVGPAAAHTRGNTSASRCSVPNRSLTVSRMVAAGTAGAMKRHSGARNRGQPALRLRCFQTRKDRWSRRPRSGPVSPPGTQAARLRVSPGGPRGCRGGAPPPHHCAVARGRPLSQLRPTGCAAAFARDPSTT